MIKSTKSIAKKCLNCWNILKLESAAAVLVHCNLVDNLVSKRIISVAFIDNN